MKSLLILFMCCLLPIVGYANDRSEIVTTIDNFYIGDKTGSKAHKIKSMHSTGAYRYVNQQGQYIEHKFTFKEGGADTSYDHELLSIDIYDQVALAKLRLENKKTAKPEYKIMLLNKITGQWRITTISWGFSIAQ